MSDVKRLKLSELVLWKRKAAAFDEALAYIPKCQSEDAIRIELILRRALEATA